MHSHSVDNREILCGRFESGHESSRGLRHTLLNGHMMLMQAVIHIQEASAAQEKHEQVALRLQGIEQ